MATPISFRNATVEVSTDGSTWTDVSGYSNKVEVSAGDRPAEEVFVFAQDYPYITPGKRKAEELKITFLYTEGVSDVFETIRAAYENATNTYIRWTAKGKTTGNFLFTCDPGIVTMPVFPTGEAHPGTAVTVVLTQKSPRIAKSLVP